MSSGPPSREIRGSFRASNIIQGFEGQPHSPGSMGGPVGQSVGPPYYVAETGSSPRAPVALLLGYVARRPEPVLSLLDWLIAICHETELTPGRQFSLADGAD
ncbi:unnamed protein product [Calypogeia fissa]